MSSFLWLSGALLLLCIVPIGIGAAVIIAARRYRTGHPRCGACGYNLTGSLGVIDRCPECGGAFAEVGIQPTQRAQKQLMFWFGIALIALPLICLVPSLTISGIGLYRAEAELQRALTAQQTQQTVTQQLADGRLDRHAAIATRLAEARANPPDFTEIPPPLNRADISALSPQESLDAIVQRALLLDQQDLPDPVRDRLIAEQVQLIEHYTAGDS